jgi:hypothetical protein
MAEQIRLQFTDERFKSAERTLLFFSPTATPEIARLAATLERLGRQETRELAFHREPYIKASSGLELYAYLKEPGWRRASGLIYAGRAGERKFEWICRPDIWLDFAGLVERLASTKSGHQYLTMSGDEAQVMVSVGEYCDADFE